MPEIPIIGNQDVGDDDYIPPKPGDDDYPTPSKPDVDESLPRSLSVTVPSITLCEQDEYDLSEKINIYPTTATQTDLRYMSNNEDIANVNGDGIIKANSIGKATIRVLTVNNISKEVNVNVLPKFEEKEIQITDVEISDRSAGIFTVTVRAEENGAGYSGPATITTVANNEGGKPITRENRIYFNRGIATIKYNGAQFGVWRTDFKTDVKVRDKEASVSYEFSKKSKSPATIVKTDGFINK